VTYVFIRKTFGIDIAIIWSISYRYRIEFEIEIPTHLYRWLRWKRWAAQPAALHLSPSLCSSLTVYWRCRPVA